MTTKPDPNSPEWFDTTRAAEYLGLKPMTLHNYRHHLAGPDCERLAHRCYYHIDALKAWHGARVKKEETRKAGKAKASAEANARAAKRKAAMEAARDSAAAA